MSCLGILDLRESLGRSLNDLYFMVVVSPVSTYGKAAEADNKQLFPQIHKLHVWPVLPAESLLPIREEILSKIRLRD